MGNGGDEVPGGAIYNSGSLVLNNSTFASNACRFVSGGAIYEEAGTVSATNCTFFGNSAGQEGGAISVSGGDLFLASCTLASNSATLNGGGVYNFSAVNMARLANCLVAGNSAGIGPDANGFFMSDGYNLIGKSDATAGFGASGDQLGTIAAPLDPRLGPLQNNGGLTWTMALRSGSPAMDQGKSFGVIADQRLHSRPVHIPLLTPATGGDTSDIGAFESDLPVLRFIEVRKLGADLRLSFPTEAGWNYAVQYRTNVASGTWTTFTNNVPGITGITMVTNTGVTGLPRRFYRARLLP